MLHKIISIVLSFNLILAQSGFCQGAFELNLGQYLGQMNSGLAMDKFRPLHLRYFSYDTATNNFQLLLDKGDSPDIKDEELQDKTKVLMEYFRIGLSLSNDKFWVNLRPDSEGEIIDPLLERTNLGKVMLESDLQLKKDTAAFTSPQSPEGRLYWDKLYQKARELFGSEPANIPTLTRPWIVPGEIIVKETDTSAYIYKANMKVMLEEDYLKTANPISSGQMYTFSDPRMKELNAYSTQLIREMILPKLTKEVNTAKRYAALRQVFFSLVMARWFKERFRGKSGEYPQTIDSNNLEGLTSKEPWSKSFYFNEYKKSFENGEYNLKEQVSTISGQVIRSYVSGGENLSPNPKNMHIDGFTGEVRGMLPTRDSLTIVAGNPKGMLVSEKNMADVGSSPLTALQKAEYDFYKFKTIIKTYADGRYGVRPGESDLGTNVSYELYNDRQEAIDAARKVARKIFGINELIDGIFANGIHSAFPEFLENERKFYIRVGLIIDFGEDSQGEVFLGINKDMRPLDSILRSEVEKYTGDREALQKVRDIAGRRFGADEMLKQIMELSAKWRSSSSPLTEEQNDRLDAYQVVGLIVQAPYMAPGEGFYLNPDWKEPRVGIAFDIDKLLKLKSLTPEEALRQADEKIGPESLKPLNREEEGEFQLYKNDRLLRQLKGDDVYYLDRGWPSMLRGRSIFVDNPMYPTKRMALEAARAKVNEDPEYWEGRISRQEGKGSSGSSPAVAEKEFGGIDFRAMDMLIQPMGSFSGLNFSLPVLSAATLESMDLDKELEDIRNMVKAGVIPSGERVKEYLAACFQKGRMAEKQNDLLLCLSEIYRLQEEEVLETSHELRESLVIVETGNFVLTS